MPWHVRPERFVVAGIAAREQPVLLRLLGGMRAKFFQITIEPELVTLLLPEDDWRACSAAFTRPQIERPYRVISFDVDLPPDLLGFMAALSATMASAGVPLLAVSSFARDHLVVREADLEWATDAIAALVAAHRV